MSASRKSKRSKLRDHYLDGTARRPYTHTPTLRRSLSESPGESSERVCARCRPILSRYSETFKGLVHQGTELIKRKKQNPNPKHPDRVSYRDLKRQNEWLRGNVFDAMGNYLYCAVCIRVSLGVSKQRLANQRKIKRQQSQVPIVEMEKSEVEEKRLGEYIIMPDDVNSAFSAWWRSVSADTVVQVRFPHERHGNAGKTSHSAKTSVMNDFLLFVDVNSQPNGRSADSSGPTSYFLPKFSTIQAPKPGIPNYEERLQRSVVGEFNRAQRESEKGECSNGSSSNWLKAHRPKVAICPHQQDYCDTCSRSKEEIRSKQTTINRLRQSASAEPSEIKQLEDDIMALNQEFERHRQVANESHKYYVQMTERCSSEWKEISELEKKSSLTDEEAEKLAVLKHKFNLVICADYQMSKLVPYWGLSPQPGSTYYLQKLSHDILGIVNHATGESTVYLFDETVGPKNTDHTVSYITHFLGILPGWIRRIHLFLDNTCSTNKNFYTMAWACEMLQQGRCDFLRISFLVAGHTKFSPDLLFSQIAKSYNQSDVFTTEELGDIIRRYATVTVDDGSLVCDWREPLSKKYSKFPGIRSQHDFVFAKNILTGQVISRTRPYCYTGSFTIATIHILANKNPEDDAIPGDEQTYHHMNKTRSISGSKMNNLVQMYRQFIPRERWHPIIGSPSSS